MCYINYLDNAVASPYFYAGNFVYIALYIWVVNYRGKIINVCIIYIYLLNMYVNENYTGYLNLDRRTLYIHIIARNYQFLRNLDFLLVEIMFFKTYTHKITLIFFWVFKKPFLFQKYEIHSNNNYKK